MLTQQIRFAALALAAGGLTLATPASALPAAHAQTWAPASAYGDLSAGYHDDDDDDDDDDDRRRWGRYDRGDRYDRYDRRDRRYARGRYYGGEPVYRNTRVWQGDDGRYYCRKSDGTTGLIIGGAAGALLGREIAGRGGDRTLGAILGAAGGALLGRSIDSKVRCN